MHMLLWVPERKETNSARTVETAEGLKVSNTFKQTFRLTSIEHSVRSMDIEEGISRRAISYLGEDM